MFMCKYSIYAYRVSRYRGSIRYAPAADPSNAAGPAWAASICTVVWWRLSGRERVRGVGVGCVAGREPVRGRDRVPSMGWG